MQGLIKALDANEIFTNEQMLKLFYSILYINENLEYFRLKGR